MRAVFDGLDVVEARDNAETVSAHSDSIVALVQIAPDGWIRCERPVRMLESDAADDVPAMLAEVERLSRDRALHAVGVLDVRSRRRVRSRHARAPRSCPDSSGSVSLTPRT